jgi:hypothetical protein
MKEGWENLFGELLSKTSLPKAVRITSVSRARSASATHRRDRDQGNHRFILEKALGDALQTGGWLLDDDWDSYEFGGLANEHTNHVYRGHVCCCSHPDAGLAVGIGPT